MGKKRSKTTDKAKVERNKNYRDLIGDFNEKEIAKFQKNSADISSYIRKNHPENAAASGPNDLENNEPIIRNNSKFIKNVYYNLEKEFEVKKRFCK